MIDLNHGSGVGYAPTPHTAREIVNSLVDAALMAENRRQTPRNYLGGSRVGEACARQLVYEITHAPRRPFAGRTLRIFAVGHAFEALTISWLRLAGFEMLTGHPDGRQFGFETGGGRIRGHIDGVIIGGPVVPGLNLPALWEHKALGNTGWSKIANHGLEGHETYFAQVQLYMAYMELEHCLFSALNKNTQDLYHEVVPFRATVAQHYSDRAVDIIRMAEDEALPAAHQRRAGRPPMQAMRLRRDMLGGSAMSDFTPSDVQAAAIAKVKTWFQNDTEQQQVFRVFGYAGTGKTTITKHAIAELGLGSHDAENDQPGVLYGAFTGKAAYVMRQKGTPARTIHSLIYSVHEATEEEVRKAKIKLDQMEIQARGYSGMERTLAEAQVEALRAEIRSMKMPRFGLNDQSDVANCKLLVLDEVSMVGPEMAKDILSFGKPILVLGDPGQLPPIKGEGAFTQDAPDVMLTEIHRQAGESAIIRLATMARQGLFIPHGRHDDFVWKMRRMDVEPNHLLRGGQVICGKNATRLELNNAMRSASGFGGLLPTGVDEKIMCLKNDGALGLINGMFIQLGSVERVDEDRFRATVVTEDGTAIGGKDDDGEPKRLDCYLGHFADHQALDLNRHDRDWKLKKKLVEATFGWAITCHKSQGSQWENVIVWDDGLGRSKEDRSRWLYTAITRAEKGLVLLD